MLLMSGLEVRLDSNLTELQLYPRSPARAKRRARMGHPQHYRKIPMRKAFHVGNFLIMHPITYQQLKEKLNVGE